GGNEDLEKETEEVTCELQNGAISSASIKSLNWQSKAMLEAKLHKQALLAEEGILRCWKGKALDLYDVHDCISIAAHIKKEFDKVYGMGWQCVVGFNFGCFFTHSPGTFIYFALETLNFLIYKGTSSDLSSLSVT
ncbi:hypothetical protein HN51_011773, partial [Arachis hypogaea]